MTKVIANGHEFTLLLDLFDPQDKAKSEALDSRYSDRLQAAGFPEDMSAATLTAVYAAMEDCIDGYLGKGALKKIMGGKKNVRDAFEQAYKPLREAIFYAVAEGGATIAKAIMLPEKYQIDNIRE